MGNHNPEAKHEASSAGNTAAARRTAAHGGDERGLDGDAKKRKKADSTVPVVLGGGNTASSRTGVHIADRSARGCWSYAENMAARRTVAYGDEEIVRHAAASGALPSRRACEDTVAAPGAGQRGLDGDAKKRGNKCSAAQEGERVKKSRSSAAEASRAEGSVKHEKKEPRLIDRYDMAVANKNAMAAVGGKMPTFVRLAAEKEAIKAAAPRMQAITRMMNQMAGGAVPAPSRAPVQRRPQPQPQTDPEPQPQPQPEILNKGVCLSIVTLCHLCP